MIYVNYQVQPYSSAERGLSHNTKVLYPPAETSRTMEVVFVYLQSSLFTIHDISSSKHLQDNRFKTLRFLINILPGACHSDKDLKMRTPSLRQPDALALHSPQQATNPSLPLTGQTPLPTKYLDYALHVGFSSRIKWNGLLLSKMMDMLTKFTETIRQLLEMN